MMWMMMICCLAPVVFILVASKGRGLGGFGWLVLVGVAVMMASHFWMMRGHRKDGQGLDSQADQNKETAPTDQNPDDHGQHTHM